MGRVNPFNLWVVSSMAAGACISAIKSISVYLSLTILLSIKNTMIPSKNWKQRIPRRSRYRVLHAPIVLNCFGTGLRNPWNKFTGNWSEWQPGFSGGTVTSPVTSWPAPRSTSFGKTLKLGLLHRRLLTGVKYFGSNIQLFYSQDFKWSLKTAHGNSYVLSELFRWRAIDRNHYLWHSTWNTHTRIMIRLFFWL